MRQIAVRVSKLENRRLPDTVDAATRYRLWTIMLLLAVYVGGYEGSEKPQDIIERTRRAHERTWSRDTWSDGFARALGFTDFQDWERHDGFGVSDIEERWMKALNSLVSGHGLTWSDPPNRALLAAVANLVHLLPLNRGLDDVREDFALWMQAEGIHPATLLAD